MNDRRNDGKTGSGSYPSRREFLTRAGFLVGGMALMGLPGFRPQPAVAADSRVSPGGSSALELDSHFIDFLRSAEGGFPKAEVFHEPANPNSVVKKHIGPPKYQDIAIHFDPLMPKPLFDWIAATLTMSYVRKNGAILTADINRAEQSRIQFTNALITEFGIPACDAFSKEIAYLYMKFSPEFTTPLAGKKSVLPAGGLNAWRSSNFRLTIPGLDCSKVSKIEELTIKQSITQNPVGPKRESQKEPGKLEFPNLVIYLPETFAGTFYAWFQDMVVKGNAGENNEKPGTLELLDQTLKGTLLTINFHHLGIFGFTPEKSEANIQKNKSVKIEMYCEQMTLGPPK